jgi:hypothetical protein
MACNSLIQAVSLLAAEKQSGYTAGANATQGGPDMAGMMSAIQDEAAQLVLKLTAFQAVMPSGTNKTNLATALTALSA